MIYRVVVHVPEVRWTYPNRISQERNVSARIVLDATVPVVERKLARLLDNLVILRVDAIDLEFTAKRRRRLDTSIV